MGKKGFDPKLLLEKHGWKSGSGLGKAEDGMTEAIKVELKMDKAGMGYDASEKFSYQWWDHVYNTAAKSIEVINGKNGVSIKRVSDVDVCTKRKNKSVKNKPMVYGNFIKTATMTDGLTEVKDTNDDSDSSSCSSAENDTGVISKMTDEELFKACGGMTGHKGARHGINMKAKLMRIQQHDEQFLRMNKTGNNAELNCSLTSMTKHDKTPDSKVASSTIGETHVDMVNERRIIKPKNKRKHKDVTATENSNEKNYSVTNEVVKLKRMKKDELKVVYAKETPGEVGKGNACEEMSVLKLKKQRKKKVAAAENMAGKNSKLELMHMKVIPEIAGSITEALFANCDKNLTEQHVESNKTSTKKQKRSSKKRKVKDMLLEHNLL